MDSLNFKIERLILQTGNAINQQRIRDLKTDDLTTAQSETILYYAGHGGNNIKDLAMHLKISHQAARKLVDKLKMKELLDAVPYEKDRRISRIYLTEKGQAQYQILKRSGSSVGSRLLKGFSEEDKKQLFAYMQKIEQNMNV